MIKLRDANANDWARLFSWRNAEPNDDAFAGRQSVTLADHLTWLDRVLADDHVRLYIAYDDSLPAIGFVRLDAAPGATPDAYHAEISISVDPQLRGRGHATQMLAMIRERLANEGPYRLTAKVLPTNYASLRLFSDLGFTITRHDDKEVILVAESARS